MTGGPAGGDPVFGGPEAPEERKAVTAAQLRFTARERELALAERSHQRWFRVVMMALVPLVTVACLSLVAWLIISERIVGVQAALALGLPGAGLLTILGLQVGWASPARRAVRSTPAAVVVRSGARLLTE